MFAYIPCVKKSSCPELWTVVLNLSQWCWEGSGGSKLLSIATMVASGMGVALREFIARAKDEEHVTCTSANPNLSTQSDNIAVNKYVEGK